MSRAFVPGYEHDVFISYAHIDNVPLQGGKQGWVTTFFENLERRLQQKLGARELSVWIDHHELLGNTPLTAQIMNALQQTATFVIIVSKSYLRSEWCSREREEFRRLMRSRAREGSRVFLVELDDVDHDKFPGEFNDLIGYRFWAIDNETGASYTIGLPVADPTDQNYFRQLNRLCVQLAEELETICRVEEGDGLLREKPTKSNGSKVFLAEVTDDLDPRREDVKDYLKQMQIGVLPETWQSHNSLEAFTQTVDRELEECAVFVQLLSDVVGKRPFGQPRGLARLQYDRALHCGKAILQWRDPKLNVDLIGQDQQSLLSLPTVRAEGIDDFKRAISKKLATEPLVTVPASPGKFVFIGADPVDRARAEELVKSSIWGGKIGYAFLPPLNDPAAIRQYMEVCLLNCDGALLMYCGADPASILNQVMLCRRILAQREPPLPTIAIYDGPPPPDGRPPLSIMLPNLRHLNCQTSQTALSEFLNGL